MLLGLRLDNLVSCHADVKKSYNTLRVTDLAKAQAGNVMRGMSERIDLVNAHIIHHVTLKPEE